HKKLALSKWTAVRPENSEKHFLIQSVTQRRRNVPATCLLEAVLNRHRARNAKSNKWHPPKSPAVTFVAVQAWFEFARWPRRAWLIKSLLRQ
ncbi:MAG: TIGR02450 family Trp-rich protein, partial [Candidatus Binatia bacterium]